MKRVILAIVLFSALTVSATNICEAYELFDIRNNLSGSYTQTCNIDLSATDPGNVPDYTSSEDYYEDEYWRYSDGYTYLCIQDTNELDPEATDYWKKLWESSKGWDPLGDATTAFTGTYDGGGFTLSNVYVNRPDEDFVGIFGRVQGSSGSTALIENVKIQTVEISGRSGVGSLLGKIDDNQYVVVQRCSATTGTINAYRTCGGLVGANNGYPNGSPKNSRSVDGSENWYKVGS